MIPLIKIVAIFAKTFTKPLIGVAKQASKRHALPLRHSFVWLGNRIHRIEVQINRKFIGIDSVNGQVTDLSDDAAFENALNFILEIVIVYGILLGIAFQEVKKGMEEKKKAKRDLEDLQESVQRLESQLLAQNERHFELQRQFLDYQIHANALLDKLNEMKVYTEEQGKRGVERDGKIFALLTQHSEELASLKKEVTFSAEKKDQNQF